MPRVAQALLTRELRRIYSSYQGMVVSQTLIASLRQDLIEFMTELRRQGVLNPDTFGNWEEHVYVEASGRSLKVWFSPQLQTVLLGESEETPSGRSSEQTLTGASVSFLARLMPSRALPTAPQIPQPDNQGLPEPKVSIGKRAANMQKEEPNDT